MGFLRFLFTRQFVKNIFYMLLIVLFAVLFGIIALRYITDHGDYVRVPDLKGKTLDSVAIELDNLELKYNILDSRKYNTNYKTHFLFFTKMAKPNFSLYNRGNFWVDKKIR